MQLGMIGLGRMGANMVRRLLTGGHQCIVYDMSAQAVQGTRQRGGGRQFLTGGTVAVTGKAAGNLADGAGRRSRPNHR